MKCQQITEGKQCGASAMRGSQYCYFHNPSISSEDKLEAQIRGGQNRSLRVSEPLSLIKIRNANDITELLIDTINKVRMGELDCRIANTIGFLTGITLKSFEISALEERVDKIEKTIVQG